MCHMRTLINVFLYPTPLSAGRLCPTYVRAALYAVVVICTQGRQSLEAREVHAPPPPPIVTDVEKGIETAIGIGVTLGYVKDVIRDPATRPRQLQFCPLLTTYTYTCGPKKHDYTPIYSQKKSCQHFFT